MTLISKIRARVAEHLPYGATIRVVSGVPGCKAESRLMEAQELLALLDAVDKVIEVKVWDVEDMGDAIADLRNAAG